MSLMYYYGVMGNRATAYVPETVYLHTPPSQHARDIWAQSPPRSVKAGWEMLPDGQLKWYEAVGESGRLFNSWVHGDLSDFDPFAYEVCALWTPNSAASTLNAGSTVADGNTWVSLSQRQHWELYFYYSGSGLGIGTRSGDLYLRIRPAGGGSDLASQTYTIEIQLEVVV